MESQEKDKYSSPVKVETYKGVDIFYDKESGKICFEFEGERIVKYVFEARQIIDEPRWEDCDLKGFYLDHLVEFYIGLAKATRRDIKTGRPDWLLKGRYDLKYKNTNFFERETKVYPDNEQNRQVYLKWKAQRAVANEESMKADNIARELK